MFYFSVDIKPIFEKVNECDQIKEYETNLIQSNANSGQKKTIVALFVKIQRVLSNYR